MEKLLQKNNGNAVITLYNDGTRQIEFDDELQLDEPLNIDIRVSTECKFGRNPLTGRAVCPFCHESAITNGEECDYDELQDKLSDLSPGIELAIGANSMTTGLFCFLDWAKEHGFICNITVNQGRIYEFQDDIRYLIDRQLIHGLGISYRRLGWDIPQDILDYPNTVFHVILGIDTIAEVRDLRRRGVKKILCLGEKDFGYNKGNVHLGSLEHRNWYWWIKKLIDEFEVVSFDNLALEQLKLKRLFLDSDWDEFNNGEHSFYINAVEGYYSPSSRSNEKISWNDVKIQDFFKKNENRLVV